MALTIFGFPGVLSYDSSVVPCIDGNEVYDPVSLEGRSTLGHQSDTRIAFNISLNRHVDPWCARCPGKSID